MGCNTSKEVQTAEDAGAKPEIKENGETVEENHVEGSDDKAASAKTITLKSTSRPNSTASTEKAEGSPEPSTDKAEVNGESEPEPATDTTGELDEIGDGEDVQKAAVKIQAVFRGHQTRKTMKQSDKPAATPEPEPTREELEAEFRADDQELCHAATKIQASFRGHMARKVKDGQKDGEATTAPADAEEELDIDLTDPELSKAAVKIQASFRGHMARKDVDGTK